MVDALVHEEVAVIHQVHVRWNVVQKIFSFCRQSARVIAWAPSLPAALQRTVQHLASHGLSIKNHRRERLTTHVERT